MKLTAQQSAAIQAVKTTNKSLILEAVAGAGKTSTLIEMLKATKGSVAFCAFNKSIAQEIESKVQKLNLPNVKVGTVHSFGFGALRRAYSHIKVNGNKLRDLALNFDFQYSSFAISAARMAKETGNTDWWEMCEHYNLWELLPDDAYESDAIKEAEELLDASNSMTSIIDFSDMIYLPVIKNLKIWSYDNVFLDEAQDTNATRRSLIKKMIKPRGRLVAVGDAHQAIYGFTGADSDALQLIQDEFKAKTLPLSVTFRCPKNVVNVAKNWVSHIESHESSPEGIVDSCTISDVAGLATQEDAIICRNTKPLIELAYQLIRNSIPCKVEGRSIGENLIKLVKRWKVKTVGTLQKKLEVYKEKQIEKYKEKNEARCQVIEDQVDTLMVFIDQCYQEDSISILIEKIQAIFDDTENKKILTLSTIHKSKGREWNRVFALGMEKYSPSKWARKDWEMQQENNLCYVQVTRAKQHLTKVIVPT